MDDAPASPTNPEPEATAVERAHHHICHQTLSAATFPASDAPATTSHRRAHQTCIDSPRQLNDAATEPIRRFHFRIG